MNLEIKLNSYLTGDHVKIGLESTIVDLTGKPSVLRLGSISVNKIQKILKKKIRISKGKKKIKAPGQLKLHYSPGIPVRMNRTSTTKNQALIGFGKKFKMGKKLF